MNNPIYSDPEWMHKFLHNAATYFESRETNGEDTAYWANVYNAEKCIKIADEITCLRARVAELEAALQEDGIMSDYHEGLEEGIKIGMEQAAKIAHEIAERGHITFNIAAGIRAKIVESQIMSSMSTKPMENMK